MYIKRTQRDYPLSFKLSVVREIEQGELSIRGALRKYGLGLGYEKFVRAKIVC